MYRGRLWTLRQYSGFGSARETNRRFRYLLAGGQTGLSVAFDLPTQIGYDSDHPRSNGEVGRCGVSISSLADMRTLFEEIPLDRATVSMTINATAPILTALLLAVGEETGVPRARLGERSRTIFSRSTSPGGRTSTLPRPPCASPPT